MVTGPLTSDMDIEPTTSPMGIPTKVNGTWASDKAKANLPVLMGKSSKDTFKEANLSGQPEEIEQGIHQKYNNP